jgi:Thioesterase-like superfamily
VIDCHYRRADADGAGQSFDPTDGTRSNWDTEIQHGSPPLALMTKLIEELAGDSGMRIGRLTLDILGAIPVARVRVRAWVERPGARISLLVAQMWASRPDGAERVVARVAAWLLQTSDTSDALTDRYPPLVEGDAVPVPHSWLGAKGYLETVTWRRQQPTGDTGNVV